ncbi:twin-arginine translocation signal domain-containing protein, partial [Pseudomonas sp. Kh14]
MTTRRHFLKGVGAASLVTLLPNFSFASTQSPNVLIWITLRGAMDGLNVVVPSFDEHYQKLRPTIALTKDQLNP